MIELGPWPRSPSPPRTPYCDTSRQLASDTPRITVLLSAPTFSVGMNSYGSKTSQAFPIHPFADEKNAIRSWPLPPDTTVSVNPSAALAGEQTAAPARRSNADRSRPTKRGFVQSWLQIVPAWSLWQRP
jgi:hypothetical protein